MAIDNSYLNIQNMSHPQYLQAQSAAQLEHYRFLQNINNNGCFNKIEIPHISNEDPRSFENGNILLLLEDI